jgi:hypothetical protein
MATWTARLETFASSPSGESLLAGVGYYDAADTGFTTVLASKQFSFPLEMTQASMVAQVRATGRVMRAGQDAAAAFLVANPIGTTISVT